MRRFLFVMLLLLVASALIVVYVVVNPAGPPDLANLMTVLTTTAMTLGTLLAIITAGS